ncbi:MAG: hypothetical protein H6829_06540 [Planctomycetes bacterium]|nr:hypothetical protein [Planctomycetota bacterium]
MKFRHSLLGLCLLAGSASAQTFVYEQPMAAGGGVLRASQLWVDPSGQNDSDNDSLAWEDFTLGQTSTVTHLRWWGQAPPPLGFYISFHHQDPNTIAIQPDLFSATSQPISEEVYASVPSIAVGGGLYQFDLTLATPLTFVGGTRYFVSVVGLTPAFSGTWQWAQSALTVSGTFWWVRGAHMYYHLYDDRAMSLGVDVGPIGTNYCGPAVANSTGQSATIAAVGSTVVTNNQLTLQADGLPQNVFGYFLNSDTQAFTPNPGGSLGNLCIGGTGLIGRHNALADIRYSGLSGSFELVVDLANLPTPTLPHAVVAGETWNFQCWYRDTVGGPASNFTDAIEIAFQ